MSNPSVTSVSLCQEPVLNSSASSIADAEGILIQDLGVDESVVGEEEVTATGEVSAGAGDDESKKTLRDQLRRTLTQRASSSGEVHPVI